MIGCWWYQCPHCGKWCLRVGTNPYYCAACEKMIDADKEEDNE